MSHPNSPAKNNTINTLITDNIDLWTSAIKKRNAVGRGSSKKIELTGIKKLRELILELAVRGKLVPQDANDEPASVLLERIAQKKAQLIADKKIKKTKELPAIADEEKPFELPQGWEYVRFIDVLDFSGGGQPPKSVFSEEKQDGYVQLIQIRDLGPNPQPVYIPKDRASKFCTENDIMVGRYGASVGKVFWGKEGAYNVALIRIHNDFNSYISGFIFQLLKSPLGQRLFTGISRSAQAGFNKDDIAPSLLPLPPLAEQHRIVTKVDELMALCDQLEQQTEHSLSAHKTLVEVLLAALIQSKNNAEFQQSWQQLNEHFDLLFTTEHSIEQLKQTILQLAVMGKLVPQNSNDEPASVLLEKIAKEKARLIADKKIKKQKPLPAITYEEKPFTLPNGWETARFYTLFYDLKYGTSKKSDYHTKGAPVLRIPNVVKGYVDSSDLKYSELSDKEKGDLKLNLGDLLLIRSNGSLSIVGSCAVVDSNHVGFAYAGYLIRVRLNSALYYSNFISLVLRSKLIREQIEKPIRSSSGVKNINSTEISRLIMPIVPLLEQHRIVAKVDELMALCEQLKSRLTDAQTTQLHLADAVVSNALNEVI
ncbi:MAG: restriction endonuclease subunit S [Alteromonadaceae bacterium]|nr:restriction endonuclease subunit S [Alteromonadaceae bacterium]